MNQTSLQRVHRKVEYIFRALFPSQGHTVREDQILLCHTIVDTLFKNELILCDAGVGIGKTYAYLIALILWRETIPPSQRRALVVSTSSVALQESLVREYIPFISKMLVEHHMISKPIHAVIRKGKERFVCDARLLKRRHQLHNGLGRNARKLMDLQDLSTCLDLDSATAVSEYDRKRVCVPAVCPKKCSVRDECRYQQYLQDAMSSHVDIQICNHNYLLADARHRAEGFHPLLQDYSALVVDEAHRLPESARQIYSHSMGAEEFSAITDLLNKEHYTFHAQRLQGRFNALLSAFSGTFWKEGDQPYEETPERLSTLTDACASLRQSVKTLSEKIPRYLIHRLEETEGFLQLFLSHSQNHVCFLHYDQAGNPSLCAADRDTAGKLERSFWGKNIPIILTSGTLASGQDFSRSLQLLGVGRYSNHPVSFPSPFDYARNCLLYFPAGECPGPGSKTETEYLSQQIIQLAEATHGHGLVLFTAYQLMATVQKQVDGKLPFPLLFAWRGNQRIVQQFKQQSNAVLFASGPCWEGIDFPGDVVSLLIIPRLPFSAPNPVSQAEQAEYPSLQDYLQMVTVPDMQRKLRQGFGRAFRLETDTCVVAILDRRAQPGQRYHQAVLDALPECPITDKISEIQNFIRARKGPDYFMEDVHHER